MEENLHCLLNPFTAVAAAAGLPSRARVNELDSWTKLPTRNYNIDAANREIRKLSSTEPTEKFAS